MEPDARPGEFDTLNGASHPRDSGIRVILVGTSGVAVAAGRIGVDVRRTGTASSVQAISKANGMSILARTTPTRLMVTSQRPYIQVCRQTQNHVRGHFIQNP